MKKVVLTLILFVFTSIYSFAQIEATTKEGKSVILNNDGTWKYVETEKSTSTVSLDCSNLISTETDKMTGRSTPMSKTLVISDDGGKTGFGIYLLKLQKTIVLTIVVRGASKCIDDKNDMNILFRDGTKLQLTNNGKFNCDGEFTLYFGGTFGKGKELDQIRNKEIETLRVWTSKSFVQKDFTKEQSQQLLKTVECLVGK